MARKLPRNYIHLKSIDNIADETIPGSFITLKLQTSQALKAGDIVKPLYFSMPNTWCTFNITGLSKGMSVDNGVIAPYNAYFATNYNRNLTFQEFLTAVEDLTGNIVTITYDDKTNKITITNITANNILLGSVTTDSDPSDEILDLLGFTTIGIAGYNFNVGQSRTGTALTYYPTLSHSILLQIKEFDNLITSSSASDVGCFSFINQSNKGEMLTYNEYQYVMSTKCNINTDKLNIKVLHSEYNSPLIGVGQWECLLGVYDKDE